MTFETGHAVGMPKLVMQLGILLVVNEKDKKIVLDSKT